MWKTYLREIIRAIKFYKKILLYYQIQNFRLDDKERENLSSEVHAS